jgi:hypothetical protein
LSNYIKILIFLLYYQIKKLFVLLLFLKKEIKNEGVWRWPGAATPIRETTHVMASDLLPPNSKSNTQSSLSTSDICCPPISPPITCPADHYQSFELGSFLEPKSTQGIPKSLILELKPEFTPIKSSLLELKSLKGNAIELDFDAFWKKPPPDCFDPKSTKEPNGSLLELISAPPPLPTP